jgi:hypothetical protein
MSRTPPVHAATAIYSEGDFIFVQLRATKGYTTELSFPATPGGMAALLRLLREREMALAVSPHAIALPVMPIQHVIDSWARDPNIEAKAARAHERAERERFRSKPREKQLEELSALFEKPNFEF